MVQGEIVGYCGLAASLEAEVRRVVLVIRGWEMGKRKGVVVLEVAAQ